MYCHYFLVLFQLIPTDSFIFYVFIYFNIMTTNKKNFKQNGYAHWWCDCTILFE